MVESIEKGRQPYPNMDVIYVDELNALSIDRTIQDFNPSIALKSGRKGPAYAAAHLFFAPQQLFQRLAASPAVGSFKSFYEIYVDFVPFESRVFVTDRLTADNTSSCIALPFVFLGHGECPIASIKS